MTETTNPTAVSCGKLFAALAKAQAAFKPIVKNKSYSLGPGKPSIHYADLSSVYAATLPALNENGLAVTHKVRSDKDGVYVDTIIGHVSGETISSGELFMPASGGNNKAQAFGSARTYACRYSLCSILGVAADDDDNGLSACEENGKQTQAKPQGFTLTQAHVDKAKAFATQSTAAYAAYFKDLPVEHRKALIDSGWHEALKRDAQMADQGAQA